MNSICKQYELICIKQYVVQERVLFSDLSCLRLLQIERYTVGGLHSAPVTALEWSTNSQKLFSGDETGLVVFTEIDFYMVTTKSL